MIITDKITYSNKRSSNNCVTKLLISIILLYQRFAPKYIRKICGYTPTCSEYGIIALKKYGTVKGIKMTIGRLLRCMPNSGGTDYP
ncbi:MAG: membrane protein insertion efficiency factor YidD [Candidatus Delongbacteria bacterium]|nr:membrane protein insertion efficiency factor YidD [Candidatus Delongbacteria bacterium]MCG2760074.1 membrane protein insertion efficiency factor YidD [Candidatus Delongbacteria bacterium]